jgi:peptidoglycan/xylan/chitin deacetylase (PgdA/CDA1 family)
VSAAFNQFGMPYTVYVLGSAILRAAEVLWQVLQQVARDLIPGLPR